MVGVGVTPLSKLLAAIYEFQARDDRRVDAKGLRAGIDALEMEFACEVREVQRSGDHLLDGNSTAASWISRICGMSLNSPAERLPRRRQPECPPTAPPAPACGEDRR